MPRPHLGTALILVDYLLRCPRHLRCGVLLPRDVSSAPWRGLVALTISLPTVATRCWADPASVCPLHDECRSFQLHSFHLFVRSVVMSRTRFPLRRLQYSSGRLRKSKTTTRFPPFTTPSSSTNAPSIQPCQRRRRRQPIEPPTAVIPLWREAGGRNRSALPTYRVQAVGGWIVDFGIGPCGHRLSVVVVSSPRIRSGLSWPRMVILVRNTLRIVVRARAGIEMTQR